MPLGVLLHRLAPSWQSLVVALLLLLGAAAAYLVASKTSMFAVRTIEVTGAPPSVAREVHGALEPLVGTSLLDISKETIDRRLGRLPAIAAASYDRAYPHTLSVYVRAAQPLAVLRQGAAGWLVATDGRVVRELEHPGLSRLPRIWLSRSATVSVGATVGRDQGAPAVAALAGLRGARLGGGVRDVVWGEGGLTLMLRRGIEVRLGDASAIRLKLEVARRILPFLPAPAYLDVSAPGRAVAGGNPQLSDGALDS
jgi:hypothetical protein